MGTGVQDRLEAELLEEVVVLLVGIARAIHARRDLRDVLGAAHCTPYHREVQRRNEERLLLRDLLALHEPAVCAARAARTCWSLSGRETLIVRAIAMTP